MATASIGPVKEMILSLELAPLGEYLATLAEPAEHSLREKLTEFARDHGVVV
jgi:phosphotransferase system enzyme I (PtsP)